MTVLLQPDYCLPAQPQMHCNSLLISNPLIPDAEQYQQRAQRPWDPYCMVQKSPICFRAHRLLYAERSSHSLQYVPQNG